MRLGVCSVASVVQYAMAIGARGGHKRRTATLMDGCRESSQPLLVETALYEV